MESNPLLLVAVPVVGLVAGFINTLAGSGSLVTLPMLILLGLPANVANGTNRVGILVQGVVSVATFRRRGALDLGGSLKLLLPSIVGAAVGAELAVDLDEALLRRVIGALMLGMLAIMLWRPQRFLETHAREQTASLSVIAPIFFVVGLYGGFIQAGVGILLLASLVLAAGQDLVRANAVKNLIVLVFTVAALAVFVANGQVDWLLGALLAVGNGAGAWLGAHLAVEKGAKFVRWVLVVILALSSVALIGDLGFAG
ncbi:MAG TPA: sulfite exporter TauE/SafE family protein [Gammaproteobacteria bacterium]|nr:sulfite exporter TauE/SafE family protein [Gammaproteobacteria bacterium]